MEDERKEILCQCNHCGNKGNLKIIGKFTNDQYDYCDGEVCFWWQNNWFLLQCPVCGDAVLYKESQEDGDFTYENGEVTNNITKKTVFPNPFIELHNTPEEIKSAYESAIKCYNINYEVSLIAFRLVLEKIAKDKEAKGKNLLTMINDLAKKKILPQTLKDCGSIIRILGNTGAHSDNTKFYFNDVLVVKELVEYIIDYVYEMPYKIQMLTKTYNLNNKINEANNAETIEQETQE